MYFYEIVVISIVFAGFAYAAWRLYSDTADPPRKLFANVVKKRVQPQKIDGKEIYKYIVTFYTAELERYIRFEISQITYDEIMENDTGVLHCKVIARKFINWDFNNVNQGQGVSNCDL
ncbi:MAG: hypothetical protein FWF79_00855 [Defluviitaleaceae bacterium]|nr:hypothetical protein [Defluviitaleaceae bacterium]